MVGYCKPITWQAPRVIERKMARGAIRSCLSGMPDMAKDESVQESARS